LALDGRKFGGIERGEGVLMPSEVSAFSLVEALEAGET
jgi:hypothetical protein